MSDPRRCPVCGGPSRVVKVEQAGPCAKRRRECQPPEGSGLRPCQVRWTTYERRSHVLVTQPDEEKGLPVYPHEEKRLP